MILAFTVFLFFIAIMSSVSVSAIYEKDALILKLIYLFFKKQWVIRKIGHTFALEIEKNEQKRIVHLSDLFIKKRRKKKKTNYIFLARVIRKIKVRVKRLSVDVGGDDAYDIAIKTGFLRSMTGAVFAVVNARLSDIKIAPRFGERESIVVFNCIFKTAMVNIIYAYIIFKAKAVIKCIQSRTYFKRP